MKRKLPSAPSASRSTRQPRERPDPFRFGWRYVTQADGNGRSNRIRVPLTPDDVLHPQEGDHIPENTIQALDRSYLFDVLRWRTRSKRHVLVLSDCLIDWGVPGLRNHSPDISAFDHVANPKRLRRRFAVVKEGAKSLLAIEIVSPDPHDSQIRDNDVVIKVEEYFRAGVPLYALIDQKKLQGPRQVIGYRPGARGYEPLPLDDQGRLLLEPVQLWLGLRDNRAVCWDAGTGEEIKDFSGMAQAHAEAEAARQAAETARRDAEAELAAARARLRELEAKARRRRP